jgi:hypothetical protein
MALHFQVSSTNNVDHLKCGCSTRNLAENWLFGRLRVNREEHRPDEDGQNRKKV